MEFRFFDCWPVLMVFLGKDECVNLYLNTFSWEKKPPVQC